MRLRQTASRKSSVQSEDEGLRSLLLISANMSLDLKRVAESESPRRDYIELARELGATVIDAESASRNGIMRAVEKVLGKDVAIVLEARRRLDATKVLFTDNERLGVLMAAALRLRWGRSVRHVMLAHHVTPPKKRPFLRFARPGISTLIVHSVAQKRVAQEILGFRSSDVVVLPYQVDASFWFPREGEIEDVVSSAGLEFRDYDTLLTAADGLGVRLVVGAASNWSRKPNTLSGRTLPSWFTVSTFDYRALRDLYWRSRFVVAPLLETDFQAGITLILEAMACGKAVLVSRNAGQRETVEGPVWTARDHAWPSAGPEIDQSTGIYVRPGDAEAMRAAMKFMLANPEVCARLGANGRRRVEQDFTIERFAQRFAEVIRQTARDNPAARRQL